MLFSIAVTAIHISTGIAGGLLFLTSSPTLVICCLFDNSHSSRCEVVSHCGFDLHVLDD